MPKLGKLPPTYDPHAFHFDDFLAAHQRRGSEHVPPEVHATLPVADDDWGMLGNDDYGDCVFAGGDHEHMLFSALGGKVVEFTDENALADYGEVTGFDPSTGKGDNGTIVADAMSYRRKTGLIDSTGERHKLGAYVQLEPGNWDHVKLALWLGHAVGIGIEFPESAMQQFDRGQPWRSVAGAQVEGGHYIPVVSVVHKHINVVTWGTTQSMSLEFYRRYCDEAYALLSPEMLTNPSAESQEHFNYDELIAKLQGLGS